MLSNGPGDPKECKEIIAEIRKIVPSANVSVAQVGMEWELRNADECPF